MIFPANYKGISQLVKEAEILPVPSQPPPGPDELQVRRVRKGKAYLEKKHIAINSNDQQCVLYPFLFGVSFTLKLEIESREKQSKIAIEGVEHGDFAMEPGGFWASQG